MKILQVCPKFIPLLAIINAKLCDCNDVALQIVKLYEESCSYHMRQVGACSNQGH
jgi:hypothetical protein